MGIEYIQEALGHTTISTAQIYRKIFQKNLSCEWILTSVSGRINR
jgi:site-specific recombinase XerD